MVHAVRQTQWTKLALCFVIAFAFYSSFQFIAETRAWWDRVDEAVFYALNGSLRLHEVWAYFWAVGNNPIFDMISALIMLYLVHMYIMQKKGEEFEYRLATFLYIIIVLGVSVGIMDRYMNFGFDRASPTIIFDDGYRLSMLTDIFKTKDSSGNSYPSDHASVLIMMTLMLWHMMGKRIGLIMLGVCLFFSMPRLFSGAHWFTDMLCGSLPLSLTFFAIAMYTPLKDWSVKWLKRFVRIPFVNAGMRTFFHPEMPMLVGKGLGMGSADVVPGVSGGTIAYITNIWDRLMHAIKSIDTAWMKLVLSGKWTEALENSHISFAVPLVGGIVVAFITFSKYIPLPVLMQVHPEPVYGMFFGLLLGSIILLVLELGRFKLVDFFCLICGIVGGWMIVTLVPMETPNSLWFIFLCGCFAICALLLPGISGAFILLIMGKYAYILDALARFDFTIIIPFVLGCLTGLFTFARVASWLVHNYYRISTTTITGVLIGSLWIIWPFQNREYVVVSGKERLIGSAPTLPEAVTTEAIVAFALGLVGFIVVMWLGIMAARKAQAAKMEA